jgi:ribosome-associated protein
MIHIPPNEIKNTIIQLLQDKKAGDIICKDIAGKSSLADYIIFASGSSTKNVASMGTHVADELKKVGLEKVTLEGFKQADWILVDTGSVILHIMHPTTREEYNLEGLWSQANEVIE